MFTIVPAAPADVPEAASVMATAFARDTVMGTLVGDDVGQSRLALLFRSLMRSGALRSGRIDLAKRDGDGLILGAAIWEEPGHRASLLAQVRELPGFLRALRFRGLRKAIALQDTLARHRPAEPHWYLAQIGVGGEARGAGVGTALLHSRLEKIDAEGASAYLESSNERNRTLYQRHGFTSIATIQGIAAARPAAMWRDSVRSRPAAVSVARPGPAHQVESPRMTASEPPSMKTT